MPLRCGRRRLRIVNGRDKSGLARVVTAPARRGSALAPQHQCRQRPDQRVEPVGRAAGRQAARAEIAHLVFQRRETRRRGAPGPARRARRPARRAAYLPRVARTLVTGTPGSASRDHRATMSPPWLTSTTSASASSRRHSATAFAAQPAAQARRRSRRRAHRRMPPSSTPGGDDAAGVGALRRARPADRPRPRCARAAAPRATRQPRSASRVHSASARSSMISPSSSWRPSRVPA